ncbi:hypothetical protein X755_06915 [Mesorhizobium sp. LNJC405B00]|nr:hypothetical protein X755_06915 [Mesorhizobium sp. LNJC405B00]
MHFAQPLTGQWPGCEHEHAGVGTPREEIMQDDPGFNRFAETHFVGKNVASHRIEDDGSRNESLMRVKVDATGQQGAQPAHLPVEARKRHEQAVPGRKHCMRIGSSLEETRGKTVSEARGQRQ